MGRTNIVLDDKLVEKAMKLTNLKTKTSVVNYSLETLIGHSKVKEIKKYKRSGIWKGNLDKMRASRL